MNLTLGLKHLTNWDHFSEGHAVTETHVFDRIYTFFSPTVIASAKGLTLLCRSTVFS